MIVTVDEKCFEGIASFWEYFAAVGDKCGHTMQPSIPRYCAFWYCAEAVNVNKVELPAVFDMDE